MTYQCTVCGNIVEAEQESCYDALDLDNKCIECYLKEINK